MWPMFVNGHRKKIVYKYSRDWPSPWMDISYAKIVGEINIQPREFPRSGSKAKDGEKKKREQA